MTAGAGAPGPREVLALYPRLTPLRRALLATRFILVPCGYLNEAIPRDARVFELGCGQGVLANFLKAASPARTVVGVDLSPSRVAVANSSVGARRGISFLVGDVARPPLRPPAPGDGRPCACIVSEVLYLLPRETAAAALRGVAGMLREGDACWIVDFCASARARRAFLALESGLLSLAVNAGRVLGLGRAATEAFGERRRPARVPRADEWRRILAEAGLRGEAVPAARRTPFPQVVFRCVGERTVTR